MLQSRSTFLVVVRNDRRNLWCNGMCKSREVKSFEAGVYMAGLEPPVSFCNQDQLDLFCLPS